MDLSQDMKEDPDQSLLKHVEYRKKMIQLMETLMASYTDSLKNPDPSNQSSSGGTVAGQVASKMKEIVQSRGDRFRELIAKEMAEYLIQVQAEMAFSMVKTADPMEGPRLSPWEKRKDWAGQLEGWLGQRVTQDQAQELWKELAGQKNPESRMELAGTMLENLT